MLEAVYQFVPWLVPTTDRFPAQPAVPAGDRLQTALNVLERLIEATYTRARRPSGRGEPRHREDARAVPAGERPAALDARRYAHAARAFDEADRLRSVSGAPKAFGQRREGVAASGAPCSLAR